MCGYSEDEDSQWIPGGAMSKPSAKPGVRASEAAIVVPRGAQRGETSPARGIAERQPGEAEHDRLIDELRQAQDQTSANLEAMTRLHRLGSLFVREGNLEPVLVEIVDAAIAISGADFGNIQLLDAESSDLRIVAHRGFPDWWLEFWNNVSRGQGVCGTALERGERVIVEDVERSPIFAGRPALEIQRRVGVRAVQSTPLVSRSGKPLGMFSTHWREPGRPDERSLRLLDLLARHAADIAERAQAEEALRASEERFRLLVQGVKDCAIYMLAPDGTVTSWSAAAEQIFGYREEEIVGQHRAVFFTDEQRRTGRPERDLLKAMGDGRCEEEDWRVRKDGSRFWASVLVTALRDNNGNLRGFANVTRDFTERMKSETALRESEGKYVAIHDKAPFGIALTKLPEATFATANDAILGLLGFSREEVIGKTSVELGISDPEAQAVVRRELGRGRSLRDFELTRHTRSGTRIDLSICAERVTIAGSEYVLTTTQDITRRKHAEETLRESEERYRSLFDNMSEGLAYCRMLYDGDRPVDFIYLDVNPAFERLTGRQGVGGMKASLLFPGIHKSDPNLIEIYGRVARGGTAERFEIYVERLRNWFDVSVYSPATDHFVALFHIITDRKRAEEDVRASEERMRLAQQVARVGTFVWDIQTGVNTWTPELEAMYGLPRGGFAGTEAAFEQLIHPEDRDRVLRWVERAMVTGAPGEGEWRAVWPDGSIHWVAGRWQVLKDDSGTPVRMTGINFDIDERKRAEELRASEAALREADRQKNQFLAMLSHELRNPLAPIKNSLYLLERAAPGGEQATRAQAVIDRQVGQLTRLIDDLLDVTRIVSGKVRLRREGLDLNEIVQRTAEDHRTLFAKSDVRLEVLPASAEVRIDGDWVRLAQVVGNLLQNAAKFTPRAGKATVSVQADPARGEAIVTVRDTGSGIHPDMLPRLFHPFTQAEATLDRSKGGLGLGLALVKGLAELHGGSVSAASEGLGKGAVFTVCLPLDGTAASAMPAPRDVDRKAVPRRVLVIEDNEDAADTLRDVLALDEHVVEVAYSGPDGIAKARAFHPEIVLCDIGLPGMDGYQVARAMRADPELGCARLVAVSGYAQPEDVAMSKDAGFDAHLAKPPSIDTLHRAMAEHGRQPSAAVDADSPGEAGASPVRVERGDAAGGPGSWTVS
jgi:PAS domain S-box-containing protein